MKSAAPGPVQEAVVPPAIENELFAPNSTPNIGMSGFRECLADLKAGWDDMTPRARVVFIGSGAVSAALFGYITVKCGPIPSLRKMLAALPDYIGQESRDWVRYTVRSALAPVGASDRPNSLPVRKQANVLAGVVMAAAVLLPAEAAPTQILPKTAAVVDRREEYS